MSRSEGKTEASSPQTAAPPQKAEKGGAARQIICSLSLSSDKARHVYALRLNEAGMLKSSPQKIIARNTDWRFLRELKTELKARGAIPGHMHHEHHRG